MKIGVLATATIISMIGFSSCVTKKEYQSLQTELSRTRKDLRVSNDNLGICQGDLKTAQASLQLRVEQYENLREQLEDVKKQRDKQLTQVGDLTVLSKSANDNIKETLSQLEKKDKYIRLLQEARSKADSINRLHLQSLHATRVLS